MSYQYPLPFDAAYQKPAHLPDVPLHVGHYEPAHGQAIQPLWSFRHQYDHEPGNPYGLPARPFYAVLAIVPLLLQHTVFRLGVELSQQVLHYMGQQHGKPPQPVGQTPVKLLRRTHAVTVTPHAVKLQHGGTAPQGGQTIPFALAFLQAAPFQL